MSYIVVATVDGVNHRRSEFNEFLSACNVDISGVELDSGIVDCEDCEEILKPRTCRFCKHMYESGKPPPDGWGVLTLYELILEHSTLDVEEYDVICTRFSPADEKQPKEPNA